MFSRFFGFAFRTWAFSCQFSLLLDILGVLDVFVVVSSCFLVCVRSVRYAMGSLRFSWPERQLKVSVHVGCEC